MILGREGPTGGSGGRRRTRVLVVDDSAVQRGMLVALLAADPELEVAGWAADGAEAVRAAARLKPDVITMDLHMPVMDGLEATRRIMAETPTPIVMITSDASPDARQRTFQALDAGVLAFLPKPTPSANDKLASADLVRTIKSMAEVKVVRRWAAGAPPQRLSSTAPPLSRPPARAPAIAAIGASTGGPQALQVILTQLPASFTVPLVVVQHIAEGFAPGLVSWLQPQCALPIQLASSGLALNRPGIYVAPTGQHLVVRGQTALLTRDPADARHRPSATVLFQSVAREYGAAY
jgi:two-component system, chemotaxis family, protein-glutamate methylesterase/glutaminase